MPDILATAPFEDEEEESCSEEEEQKKEKEPEIWGELLRTSSSLANDNEEDKKIKFASSKDKYIIGRDPSVEIIVQDPHVSSKHCTIYRDEDKLVWVQDHSLAGTFINGEKIEKNSRKRLYAGDSLCLLRPSSQHVSHNNDKKKKSPSKASSTHHHHEFVFREHTIRQGPCVGEINDKYEVMDIIGSGSFATVRKGVEKKTGLEVAVKIVEKKNFQFEPEKWKDQMKEIEMLKRLDHEGCVRMLDTYTTPDALYIVMEFVKGGELFDRIVKNGKIPEEATRVLIKRLLEAVSYLHGQGIVHRDLKPENILILHKEDCCFHIKVADFGVARLVGNGCKTLTGSMSYIAPEVLERRDTVHALGTYDYACDLWSVGVIVYVCIMGKLPFKSAVDDDDVVGDLKESVENLLKFKGKEWKEISESAKDFLAGLFRTDTTKRLTAIEAMQHPWISDAGFVVEGETCGEEQDPEKREVKRKKLTAPPVPLW